MLKQIITELQTAGKIQPIAVIVLAKAAVCSKCGGKEFALMATDFETSKCTNCGKIYDQEVEAGGPVSGRRSTGKTQETGRTRLIDGIKYLMRDQRSTSELRALHQQFQQKYKSDMPFHKWLGERGKVHIKIESAAQAQPGDRWITQNGQHILIGPDGERKAGNPKAYPGKGNKVAKEAKEDKSKQTEIMDRTLRAKLAAKLCGVKEQRKADKEEIFLSKALGIPRTGNNRPFDLQDHKTGVEVKTLLNQKNDKITMNHGAKERKLLEAKKSRLKNVYTVIVDSRPGQKGYYIKQGVGSFRLSTMQHVSDINQLKLKLR